MTDSEKEQLSIEAQNLRFSAKQIQLKLLPKLNQFRDEFKASEWTVIESAMHNYVIDINQRATRLEVLVQQPF